MTEQRLSIRLVVEVERLRRELRDAEQRLDEARVAESGISIGDIVRGKGGRWPGKLFRVSRIDAQYSPPWLHGNPCRQDGTFGKNEHGLFNDWEGVT